MRIHIHNHSYHEVVSGGDAIAVEFANAWKKTHHQVLLFTHFDARKFFVLRGFDAKALYISTYHNDPQNVLFASILHTIYGIILSFKTMFFPVDVIFAASCMFEDLLPALIHKFFHPSAHLVTSIYIIPQHPQKKSYGSTPLHRYAFWIMFQFGMLLSRWFANTIWTASIEDERVLKSAWHKNVFAIRGGVDIQAGLSTIRDKPIYDAISLGRFHPQKNQLELLAIWKKVTKTIKNATLALVGEGFMKQTIEKEILRLKLTKNVIVLPAVDGKEKFSLYASSKIFLSTSHYDTGNLALDESLSTATPAICYDIAHLSYPEGVILSPCFDTDQFTINVVRLLCNEPIRQKLGKKAQEFAKTISWDIQAATALESLTNNT